MRHALVILLTLLVGCTARYQVNNLAGAASAQLDRTKGLYVTVPQDGAYGTTVSFGSGQIVAQAVADAFSGVGARVHIAERAVGKDQSIVAAKSLNASYLVMPAIVHWEQRATEWSGRPSRMAIRLSIIDVTTGDEVTSSAIEGRSRIVSFTSTTPESLLRDPLARYVRGLYQSAGT
jgi:hypothetical protein